MQLSNIKALKDVSIHVGSVFKMTFYPQDGASPKGDHAIGRDKYFVIAGIDSEGNYIGATIINTNVNINFAHKIASYQHCIYPDKYPFLNKKYRFIDCYILREIKKERIIEEAEYIACLDDNDMDKVRQLLRSSPIIDKSTIEQYGL